MKMERRSVPDELLGIIISGGGDDSSKVLPVGQ